MTLGGHLQAETMTQKQVRQGTRSPALSKASVKTAIVNGDTVLEEGEKKGFLCI